MFKLSNGTSLNELQLFQGHDYSTSNNSKWYNVELFLRRPTNRKSYMIYRTAPFSMILNDPVSWSLNSLTLNISEMVRDTDSFNGILIRIYTHPTVTRSVARSLCDSWASCFFQCGMCLFARGGVRRSSFIIIIINLLRTHVLNKRPWNFDWRKK